MKRRELIKGAAGVNINHVPYKGTGPAIAAVMRLLRLTDRENSAP